MSAIQLNDFKASWEVHRDDILRIVDRVGMSGWLILGSEVRGFESALAEYWKLCHCVGCASGLDALELALRASGLEVGQKVLTTPLSAFATSLAIVRAGGVPVFVDVDESGQIDLDLCEAAMTQYPDIRYLIPVHLYGHANNLERMTALRDRFALTIIEDCAQAVGAKSRGKPVGSVGAFAATSFYPTKNLGCMGDGGAVLTNDSDGSDRLRALRDYGQSAKFQHSELGLNSRLDEVQAAIMRHAFLPALDRGTRKRIEIAARYREEIANPHLAMLPIPEGSESVWHLYPMMVLDDSAGDDDIQSVRQSFREHLQALEIYSGVHYPVLIPDQGALASFGSDISLTPTPRAKRLADSEVSLPIHPHLVEEHVDRVVEACNSWRC